MEEQLEAALPQQTWKYASMRSSQQIVFSIEPRTSVNTSALSAAVALELSGESCLALSLARVILTFRWTKEAGASRSHRNTFFAAAPSTHSWRSHIALLACRHERER